MNATKVEFLVNTHGHVEVTAENISAVRRVKRAERGPGYRLRRWCGLEPTSYLVTEHGYPVGRLMLRDMPVDCKPQIGDVLVTQAAAVA